MRFSRSNLGTRRWRRPSGAAWAKAGAGADQYADFPYLRMRLPDARPIAPAGAVPPAERTAYPAVKNHKTNGAAGLRPSPRLVYSSDDATHGVRAATLSSWTVRREWAQRRLKPCDMDSGHRVGSHATTTRCIRAIGNSARHEIQELDDPADRASRRG